MEEQRSGTSRKRADEEQDVEAHRAKARPRSEDERDEGKSDDTPDVEAHREGRAPLDRS